MAQPVGMLPTVHMEQFIRLFNDKLNLFELQRKWRHRHAFFMITFLCRAQDMIIGGVDAQQPEAANSLHHWPTKENWHLVS